ncbi:MAG: hypothetical protein ABI581_11510 [Sediminibacterium sp.]
MDKHGQDEPRKHVPTMKGLEKLADDHPDADIDTKYQDNNGKEESKDGEQNPKTDQPETH